MEKKLYIGALVLYLIAIVCIMVAMITKRPIFTIFGAAAMVIGWCIRTYTNKKFGGK